MKNLPLDYGIGKSLSNCAAFRGFFLLLLLLLVHSLSAVDFLAEGEKQLGLNNPKKALTYLEAAVAQGDPTEKLYLELGLTYTRLDMNVEAQKAFSSGADLGGGSRATLLFNLGVARSKAKDFSGAEKAFTTLLDENPDYPEALLNRANARVELQEWDQSVADYQKYQTVAPNNPQKDKIDRLISLLQNASMEAQALALADQTRKQREEEAKKAQEALDAQAKAEADQKALEAKQEADRVAAEEQAKQDAILARIRDTLLGASSDSKSLTAGPGNVKSDEGDFALEP